MTLKLIATVLNRPLSERIASAFIVAIVSVVSASPVAAQSAGAAFSGLYLGADLGRQHVIGGSQIDDVDTLQEDSRIVGSLFAGLRGQFGGFVLGGELGVGRTDGDLLLQDPSRALTVDFENDGQWHWALTAGHTLGSGTLLFGYLSEVTREFAVTIRRAGSSVARQDEQGLLRFGAGLEQRLLGPLHLRATVGTSRADFGDRQTNVRIARRLDASAGIVFQF